MRLDRLEISGFKSFSDRAELAFDQGVTAIVGPNGCGKSNVADAITWVLGEQSAKSLRGEKMEDVIFNGSDARKPGAAAEVRLRLGGVPAPPQAETAVPADRVEGLEEFRASGPAGNGHGEHTGNGHGNGNGHGHTSLKELSEAFTREVEVTRRLYRSGESEYLIDGVACRLRDVHELLMDTGLGAKAYSIIEQGKIGMILSSRPTDRRQLIEEAAGITKYRSRRRAAELKLEAAQQNLVRIDDIVFEVEKQRGALKRQAAKARRYGRLREEYRRWEKVLFARRYRDLASAIEGARGRLALARERETAAAGRLAEVEAGMARLRIEQAEADSRAAKVREEAHAREIDINLRQQQQAFNRQQVETLDSRTTEIAAEVQELEGRREPARIALDARRAVAVDIARSRDEAAGALAAAGDEHTRALADVEALEGAVEEVRGELFRSTNAAMTVRHVLEHTAVQTERAGEQLGRLDVEQEDVRRERTKVDSDRASAADALARAQSALDSVRLDLAGRKSQLAVSRAEHEGRTKELRAREQECAALEARLASLEELAASRADFGDAARMVLVQANGRVGQQGAVADFLEVDGRYERAVEACLGDLLQHVIVERQEQAAAGLALVRQQDAGRCGFVVVEPGANGHHPYEALRVPGVVPVSEVLRVTGPHAATILKVIPEAYVAETFEQAAVLAHETFAPVATVDGDVFHGPHLVAGGAKVASRGILATRREIKELRERVEIERQSLARLSDTVAHLDHDIAQAVGAIAGLHDQEHAHEKAIVGHESQLTRAAEDEARLERRAEVVAMERRRAEEERAALDIRRAEAEASIARLEEEQRFVEQRLADAQRRLADGRETVSRLGARAAEARASHAALVERVAAIEAEVERLEEGARELEMRIASRIAEREQTQARREALIAAIASGERALDEDVRALESLRETLRGADDAAAALRAAVDERDAATREARRSLEEIRVEVGELEVARATAESDLTHLAQTCVDALQITLDDVLAQVQQMEQEGRTTPDAAALSAEEPDPEAEEEPAAAAAAPVAEAVAEPAVPVTVMTAEEAIARLKEKIDRLGPVNMMAIEQFDELEQRHVFLTTQRRDLVDSIAQTSEAIARIDETTRIRFNEAFTAIQSNFQGTFGTLFGGGRASLTLLDENDPLESGIDIVASPPGKRLQSVQLLSGGEKALTAIALMFAIFKYKPSPFCLLDEIDAPLDDANVHRFVEMLRGMLDRTQFILITHNRQTMEIANRLYGVTMEEPGVSKLISLKLN
jgi:chromosome segregation protein